MNKILVICGPTATGKTRLAIKLAKKFNGEIISADSRQVYKRMDVGTGKDLPVNSTAKLVTQLQIPNYKKKLKIGAWKLGFYLIQGIKLWGYDLVDPKDNFSVSLYIRTVRVVIKDIWKRNKLPILVGGTGLYIKGVIDGIETAHVRPDLELRKSLEGKSAHELFEILASVNPIKSASLNISDKKNSRRLVRAIEIVKSGLRLKISKQMSYPLLVGLTLPRLELNRRIKERVRKRVEAGQEKEIKQLLESGISWNSQAMQALGYKEWRGYFLGSEHIRDVIKQWTKNEIKYSKRQITWFKKDNRIHWVDIQNKDWRSHVENLVKRWHNM